MPRATLWAPLPFPHSQREMPALRCSHEPQGPGNPELKFICGRISVITGPWIIGVSKTWGPAQFWPAHQKQIRAPQEPRGREEKQKIVQLQLEVLFRRSQISTSITGQLQNILTPQGTIIKWNRYLERWARKLNWWTDQIRKTWLLQ